MLKYMVHGMALYTWYIVYRNEPAIFPINKSFFFLLLGLSEKSLYRKNLAKIISTSLLYWSF